MSGRCTSELDSAGIELLSIISHRSLRTRAMKGNGSTNLPCLRAKARDIVERDTISQATCQASVLCVFVNARNIEHMYKHTLNSFCSQPPVL